jgi:hypothetical protein
MKSFFQNGLSQPPIRSNKEGKGKGRDSRVIGFAPRNLPEEAPFILPEMDSSCRDTANLWPKRISPLSAEHIPLPYEGTSAVEVMLSADSGASLGDLLFRFIEWNISPPPIDLTDEEVRGTFNPPDGTTLYPAYDQLPPDLLPLVAENASYSTYVHLIPL